MTFWKISLHLCSQNFKRFWGQLISQWVSDSAFEVSDFSESSTSENKFVKQLGLGS